MLRFRRDVDVEVEVDVEVDVELLAVVESNTAINAHFFQFRLMFFVEMIINQSYR